MILSHSEEEHSGALLAMKREYPEMECHIIASGDEAVLGEHVFRFIKTPGLHWNDHMVTYFEKEEILFSNDLFGQLLASEPPLDSGCTEEVFIKALDAYYARVLLKATGKCHLNFYQKALPV